MGRLSWISWVSCNPKGPYQRQTGTQSPRRGCDDRGRDGSEVAMSHGILTLEESRDTFSARVSRRNTALLTPPFEPRNTQSSHQGCGTIRQQMSFLPLFLWLLVTAAMGSSYTRHCRYNSMTFSHVHWLSLLGTETMSPEHLTHEGECQC